jgi:Uma2 family endonuclease
MSAIAHKLLTAAEFARLPNPADGAKQELVRGEVITMPPPGFRHGRGQVRIAGLLDRFVTAKQLGRITVETGLITELDPDTVRGPDVSFWSYERLPINIVPEGYPDVAADLCVEILSPGDRLSRLREKIAEYFARGVRMVWVVDPENRSVTVYRSPTEEHVLSEGATLSGEDVLSGFTCLVSELFD